ncbi:Hsp33 family molecular chaperone [Methyloligella solikamskensis]|uniref:Hsp33 family molecular chaperone n=1 Tax=Methyloligella solikamskensis TaxID=1177756 RepID=A0ABW3JCN1_9HYPH
MAGPSQEMAELVIPKDDLALPFQAELSHVTGRLVKLGPTVDDILSRHDYPEPVSELLGEAVALAALLGAALKFEGKFILQASTDGPVDLLVADYQTPGQLRAYARFDKEQVDALGTDGVDSATLLGNGHFAMTIDRGPDMERYQGIVPLEGETLSEAADIYFRQSEQLPTFLKLVTAKHYQGEDKSWSWRAGGLLVQKLTTEGGLASEADEAAEDEDWNRARLLAETVEDHELLDPTLAAERLLYRLFHEERVRAYSPLPLDPYCSCSRDRIENILTNFTDEEVEDMTVDNEIEVTCEFCNKQYSFDPAEINAKRKPN